MLQPILWSSHPNPYRLSVHLFGHRIEELVVNVADSYLPESLGANAAANSHWVWSPWGRGITLVQYFFLTSLNPSSNSICFLCSRKMIRSPGTMMAPPSHSHRLPLWSSSAKMHLPRQKPSCGSSLAPRNRPPSGSEPLTLLPPEPKLRQGRWISGRFGKKLGHLPPIKKLRLPTRFRLSLL
jgi:hypothetical protein